MRTSLLIGSSLLALVVGCSSSDPKVHPIDAKVFKDAAPDAPHLCGADAMYGQLSLGTMAAPLARQNFDRIMQGADMGKLEWFIAARLSMGTSPPIDGLIIDVTQPGTAAAPTPFQTNTPYTFETDATTTGSIVADCYILGDFDGMQTVQNIYWAQQGAVTFTTFSGTAMNSNINGTVTMVPFKEIDQDTGEVMAGGCSTSIGGLNFFLSQNAAPPAREAPDGTFGDPKLDAAVQRIKELKAMRTAM